LRAIVAGAAAAIAVLVLSRAQSTLLSMVSSSVSERPCLFAFFDQVAFEQLGGWVCAKEV